MTGLTRRTMFLATATAGLFGSSACADIPRVFHLPSASMEPTIMQGEYFLATPILNASDLNHGDIVVFHQSDAETFVKRIIALAGDHVSFSGGRPTLNGVEAGWAPQATRGPFRTVEESLNGRSYLVEFGSGSEIRDVAEIVVPAGQVYVVGDSRDRSFDSRVPIFGPVLLRAVSHKATSILRSDDPARVGRILT